MHPLIALALAFTSAAFGLLVGVVAYRWSHQDQEADLEVQRQALNAGWQELTKHKEAHDRAVSQVLSVLRPRQTTSRMH